MVRRASVTDLLQSSAQGDAAAYDELFKRVYDDLKRIARAQVRSSARGLTLNPTTLLHETWLRFARLDKSSVEGTAHFYNIASLAMRHIICDLAGRKSADKRGGELVRTELTDRLEEENKPLDELLAVHAAVDKLRDADADLAAIVEWHYFAGVSVQEIANVKGISDRTVKRQLALGRAFLHSALEPEAARNPAL